MPVFKAPEQAVQSGAQAYLSSAVNMVSKLVSGTTAPTTASKPVERSATMQGSIRPTTTPAPAPVPVQTSTADDIFDQIQSNSIKNQSNSMTNQSNSMTNLSNSFEDDENNWNDIESDLDDDDFDSFTPKNSKTIVGVKSKTKVVDPFADDEDEKNNQDLFVDTTETAPAGML